MENLEYWLKMIEEFSLYSPNSKDINLFFVSEYEWDNLMEEEKPKSRRGRKPKAHRAVDKFVEMKSTN